MLTDDDIFVCENGSPEDLKVHIAALRAELAQAREALEQIGELAESITHQGIYPLKVDTILEITSDALRACAADTRNTDPASSGGG